MALILEDASMLVEFILIGIPLLFIFLYGCVYWSTRKPLWTPLGNFYVDPKTNERIPFAPFSDPPSVDVSLIVPAYNESARLPKMLDETLSYLNHRQRTKPSFTWEIVIVNDGSKDDTVKTAMKFVESYGTEKIRVLNLTQNVGKGGAVRRGMLCGRGRMLLMVDGDGATRISDMELLEEQVRMLAMNDRDERAVAVGSRYINPQSNQVERSSFRRFVSWGFHMLIVLTGCVWSIQDTQCGFKMFSRRAAQILFTNLHLERWAFDVEILFIAQKEKMPMQEVQVNWQEIEGTKLKFMAVVNMAKDIVLVALAYRFGLWKVKVVPV